MATDIINDDVLIKQLCSGDERAFCDLIRRYHASCFRIVKAMVGNDNAEEVMQEAWLSVYKNIKNFARKSSLKTWLIRIAINAAKSRIRYDKARVLNKELEQDNAPHFLDNGHWPNLLIPWQDDSPEDILGSEQLINQIQSCVDQLPTIQQTILIMYDIEGEQMTEICNLLDISASNFRVLLHRARRKIRDIISQYQDGEHVNL